MVASDKKEEADDFVPQAVGGTNDRWHDVTYELITLVNHAGCSHVFMVAKELGSAR